MILEARTRAGFVYEEIDIDGDAEEGLAEEISEDFKNQIRSVMNVVKAKNMQKGIGSGGLLEFLEELVKVVIPFDELLAIAIKNHVIPSIENKCWKNPMKRMRAHGITLPGQGVETTASKLVITIDTSGSVSSDDLKKFLSVCKDSLMHFNEILVLQHDYKITKITVVDNTNIENGLDDISHFEGRGGTSHKEVFEYIEKELWHNDEDVGLIIMLTDYYSDVEELWTQYNWVNEYPVKIVLNHSSVNIVSSKVDEHPIVMREDK